MSATPRQIQCFTLFEAQGYPPEAAAAWVGNFSEESGANLPSAFRSGPLDHGSQGLAQWRLDRLTNYERYVASLHPGLSINELWPWYGRMDYQVAFAAQECRTTYPELDAELRRGGSIATLTAAICWEYERPNVAEANLNYRVAQALAVFAAAPSLMSHSPAGTTVSNIQVAQKQANGKGAAATAVGATIAASAAVASQATWHMPWWGWILAAAAAIFIIVIIVEMVKSFTSASTTLATLPAPKSAPIPVPPTQAPALVPVPTSSPALVSDPSTQAPSTPAPAPATPASTEPGT